MVQSNQAQQRYHGRRGSLPQFRRPPVGRVLFQGIVNAIPMVVAPIITK